MPRCRWQEEGRCFVVQRSIFSRRRRSPQKISGTANVHSTSQLDLIGIVRAITVGSSGARGANKETSFVYQDKRGFLCSVEKERFM